MNKGSILSSIGLSKTLTAFLFINDTTVNQMIICTRHLFFSYTFRMFDQNEEAEISAENELSLKAQLTASETNIKQKDK